MPMRLLPSRRAARRAPAARRPRRAGFSLIEIIIAMTLLAVVLSTLAYLAGAAATRAKANSRNTYRMALANELTDQFIALPYDTLDLKVRTDTLAAGGQRYARRVQVAAIGTSTIKKKVSITIIPLLSRKDSLRVELYRSRPNTENVLNTP